ncbi:MAG: hypothetical protein J6B76_00565 [Peptococcaceae bacterium]|nr:hypothetical protein [Peptococcaceae bacterium]
MQNKKIHLAVLITENRVGNMGALSSVMYAREELVRQGYLVKVLCFGAYDELIADVGKYKPCFAAIVEGYDGKVDLEVYHQVLPDWDRYKASYMAARDIIRHTIRMRKMHNRYVQAGYTMQWMQMINAPAVYVRLGMDRLDMDEMFMQGRAITMSLQPEN